MAAAFNRILKDADFNDFKTFLKSNNFTFETETEKAFDEALKVAKEEALNGVIDKEFTSLIQTLNTYKTDAIDANKAQLMSLLSEEIVKRYFYREGMYSYYITHNTEVKKGTEILKNPSTYLNYLQ